MQIPVDDELRSICLSIVAEGLTLDRWSQIESDDMFQSPSFCGGFDATEREFLFSWYASDSNEYWFGLSMVEVNEIADGESPEIQGRPSND